MPVARKRVAKQPAKVVWLIDGEEAYTSFELAVKAALGNAYEDNYVDIDGKMITRVEVVE